MCLVSDITKQLLPYSFLKGIGPVALRTIAPLLAKGHDVYSIRNLVSKVNKAIPSPDAWEEACSQAELQLDKSLVHQAKIISVLDEEFPKLAKEFGPCILYMKGDLNAFKNAVAVIGTRKPTLHGQIMTERLTNYLVKQNKSILSGLAIGCDSIAHRTSLSLAGRTVAVLAHGLQEITPPTNKDLAEEILDKGGALVSEFEFGVKPSRVLYAKRDATQAALSEGIVLIQSSEDGGSLHASRHTLKIGRWLAAMQPTALDLQNNSDAVKANAILSFGENADKVALLKCKNEHLSQLRILRSKEDYPQLLNPK